LLAFDRERVWHPYGGLPASPPAPLPVISAEGVRLRLADGRELIDGMASWWCAIHGYRHPALDAVVREQVERMAHVMFGGLTHEPAIRLAERLIALTPDGLEQVFFADSGSVSVEVAIKLALQYQRAIGRPQRTRLLALRGGYHGDTLGAMSLCDPIGGMHRLFTGVLPQHVFADRPPGGFDCGLDERWAAHVRELIAAHAHAGVVPDVMCVGKALTGGYMTLAATICTAAVAEAVSGGEGGGLMHGPTFMANPLACSVALASLDLLAGDGGWSGVESGGAGAGGSGAESWDAEDGRGDGDGREGRGWQEDVARIERGLRAGLEPARELPGVVDVRVLGAIGVVQIDRDVDVAVTTSAAVDRGVWLRPFRNLIYAMPPYVIGEEDLTRVAEAMVVAVGAEAR
jgi:adenosylmethionine---8-amino-7-oxononanoate aminotransferase